MKKLRLIIFAIFLQAALFALPSCTFFYGESADLTYPAMFDALWKDYNETYALFDVRGNRGGLTGNVTRISGRFCAENKELFIKIGSTPKTFVICSFASFGMPWLVSSKKYFGFIVSFAFTKSQNKPLRAPFSPSLFPLARLKS